MTCANCGLTIRLPRVGSYPASVMWVHDRSPLGAGNRYCGSGANLATPSQIAAKP